MHYYWNRFFFVLLSEIRISVTQHTWNNFKSILKRRTFRFIFRIDTERSLINNNTCFRRSCRSRIIQYHCSAICSECFSYHEIRYYGHLGYIIYNDYIRISKIGYVRPVLLLLRLIIKTCRWSHVFWSTEWRMETQCIAYDYWGVVKLSPK
jgi:hypothetical protein